MYVVLDVWTPGVVSMAEAWITLLAMGVFVLHSYCQDRRWFTKKDDHSAEEEEEEEEDDKKRELAEEGIPHHVVSGCIPPDLTCADVSCLGRGWLLKGVAPMRRGTREDED